MEGQGYLSFARLQTQDELGEPRDFQQKRLFVQRHKSFGSPNNAIEGLRYDISYTPQSVTPQGAWHTLPLPPHSFSWSNHAYPKHRHPRPAVP